jgi:hypothetical protein
MQRAHVSWACATALPILAGCGEAPGGPRWADVGRVCPPWAPATPLPTAARDSLPPPEPNDTTWHPDARGAHLARRLPGGWGGQFGEDGHWAIYLTAPERGREVTALLRLPPGVRVRRGRWDYAQLYDWYRYLSPHTHGLAMVSLGIDVAHNRILLGVLDAATRRQLEERLAALRIPCYLVAIQVEQRPVVAAAPANESLQQTAPSRILVQHRPPSSSGATGIAPAGPERRS